VVCAEHDKSWLGGLSSAGRAILRYAADCIADASREPNHRARRILNVPASSVVAVRGNGNVPNTATVGEDPGSGIATPRPTDRIIAHLAEHPNRSAKRLQRR
jgi:hypothetical protein